MFRPVATVRPGFQQNWCDRFFEMASVPDETGVFESDSTVRYFDDLVTLLYVMPRAPVRIHARQVVIVGA